MRLNPSGKFFKNASQYTVKLIKPDGKVAGAGEKVTFNIMEYSTKEQQTNQE